MKDETKILLNESWREMLGSWSKTILKLMYGDTPMVATLDGKTPSGLMSEQEDDGDGEGRKFVIRGKYKDVESYANAISAQKNYLDAYVEYGTEHPQTARQRAFLKTAIQKFESTTGLEWPFKDEE